MPSLVVSASTRTIVKMKGNRFWSFAMNVVVGDFLCSEAGATSLGKKMVREVHVALVRDPY